ncbi:MAG TPA: hypothetical protein VM901_02195 [Bdellovibrionota bacterium]|jgi:hypothetical protein|nr:hypothetical protein [Bdellovibrionota bacterium]
MNCHHCQTQVDVSGALGFRESCPKCHRDLHSCVNCDFYSPSHKWECRETIDERVGDKEKGNFCGSFAPKKAGASTGPTAPSKNDLLSAAEALFRKK